MPTYDVTVEGKTYEVDAPDERTAWGWANYTHRQKQAEAAKEKPATGLGAALGKGIEGLISSGRTAFGALTGSAEEAATAGLARQEALSKKYADQVSLEKVKQAYAERGLLPAVGEVLSQAPYALTEQAPNIASSMAGASAGARAGAMLGSVVPGLGTGVGALVGGGLGAFMPSFIQQLGGNVERQAQAQKEAGQPLDISTARAAGYAVPQAMLDVAGTFIPLGRNIVGKVLGPEVEKLLAKGSKEAAEKLAQESLAKTLLKGTAIGTVAEVPTEITQQVLERAQAGLSLTDDDALKEYGETAYQVGLLAPIGAAGRLADRSAARADIALQKQEAEAKKAKAEREAEEAKKKDPAYALKLDADYQAAVTRMQELQAAVPKRPGKDALPEEQMAYRAAVDARNTHLKEVLQPLAAEYVPRKAEIAQLKEQQRVAGLTPEQYALEQAGEKAPDLTPPTPPVDTSFVELAQPLAPQTGQPSAAERYAAERIQLANEQTFGTATGKDYADYLMQDPNMAAQVVADKVPLPGLDRSASNLIRKEVAKQLNKYLEAQAAETMAGRPDLYRPKETADTLALWKQAIEAEARMREEEAMAVEPVRKEEAVISPEREEQIKALETARQNYRNAADAYLKVKGTPDGPRALQELVAARKEYESFAPAPLMGQAPAPVLSAKTEAQLDKALTEVAGAPPASAQELEARIQSLADTRKTAIAKVSENASELAQYEKLTQYIGTPQGLSEIARTPEMAEAAKRRMTPMLEQAQASRNEAIAAAIQEIKLQRDASGLVPLNKSDADLQNEFSAKLNADLQKVKGKAKVDDKKRQEAIAQQLQRINTRIQQLEGGDRTGRLMGYASAFKSEPERVGELNNLYKAHRNLSVQQGLTPQAAQLNRTLQNLVDFYTVGSGAAKPRIVAKGPREARRELVLGARSFTGYEPTVEGTEVRYEKPRKMAEYKATPEEQTLVEEMRARELAELNTAADQQYTPETSDKAKKQIFDALRARIDNFNAPATQEEVNTAKAQAAPQDQTTGDLFVAATERAQAELQAAGERRAAARSEVGRAMAGMRGKSAVMDQAQRLAEKFGKDLGLQGTFTEAKKRLTQAQAAKREAETKFKEKEQEALRAAADDALIAQRNAEATSRAANNTVEAIEARLAAEKETPAVEVRTPPRARVLLQKIVELQALIGGRGEQTLTPDKAQPPTKFSPTQFVFRRAAKEKTDADVGSVQDALNQALSAAKQGEAWASDIEQVQAHMATLEKYLSRREAQGRLSLAAELMAKEWYRKLAAHEVALRRPMYGAGQLTPAEIRDYTQRRLELAQAEYDRIQLQIDGLHRQLLDTEVAVAKREVDRITGEINTLVSRMERREGADLANQELAALSAQYKDAVANLDAAQKTFAERKKAESVPFTRKSPGPALTQWMKGAQERFDASVQRFKDKQKALERQATAPAGTFATTAAERRAEVEKERSGLSLPELQTQLEGALKAQTKLKRQGSKKQREALAEKIAGLRAQIARLSGESTFGTEYYAETEQAQAAQEAREEAEAREAGKEETTKAGRRKAAKEIFGVQRTIAETGEVPQAAKDAKQIDAVIKSNRQAFEMAVEQGFKSTAIRPQKRGKSATPERLMRTPLEGIAYRLRQEIKEKLAAPRTKKQTQELNQLREHLRGLEEAINTPPVTVEERRRTARAIWAKLPKDMRQETVDKLGGRLPSGGVSMSFFDRFADALETTTIRQRLGQPLSQTGITSVSKEELAPIQAETEKRVAATMAATEALRTKYYEQKEKELSDKARLKGVVDAATQKQIEQEANEFADRVVQRIKEEEAREATQRMTEPMRGKRGAEDEELDSWTLNDVSFSRGPTAEPSTTASVRSELGKVFPDLGRVQIYDSVEALIAANPQYKGKIPADARGFVDTAGNKAFLIAENIDKGNALSVLLHEVGAHIGLKKLVGEAQYKALVKAVESWEKRKDSSTESRVADAARQRVKDAKTPANQVDDELLAYAIEEAVKAGVQPMKTKGPIGQWLSQIATLFRKALQKFGLPPKALDAQSLVDMAFGAAQMEMAPAVPQMSRRQFLRGAGAALGALKLPPLSKDMKLDALEAAWNASMDAAYTWFDAAKATAKTSGLNKLINKFDLDVDNESFATALYNTSEDLYNHVHYYSYGNLSDASEVSYYDRSYLEEHGVKALAELQQALQAQRTALIDAVKNYEKEKGMPEVGELFFGRQTAKKSFSAEFKRWFGDSKVVDDAGKPRVVYHGTGGDFSTFDLARSGSASGQVFGNGFYFAADPGMASAYAGEETPSVAPAYISIQNPFITTRTDLSEEQKAKLRSDKRLGQAFREAEDEYPEASAWWMLQRAGVISKDRANYIRDALTLVGFDGLIAKDEYPTERSDETEYVAFRPDQIKSAIGNVGAYGQRPITKEEAARLGMTPEQAAAEQAAGNILFSRNLPTASRVADQIIGKQPTIIDSIKKNLFGLNFRTQVIDALAPLEHIANTSMDALNGAQMMYYLRKYGMRNHMTEEAIETGVPQIKEITRADGQKEWVIEAVPGNNIKDAVKRLATKDVIKEAGSADAANRLFTLYLAAIRGERVGYDKLNFGRAAAQSELQQIERDLASSRLDPEDKTQLNARKTYLEKNLAGMPTEADFRAAKAEIEANDTLKKAFDEVRELYNGYNTDLLNFLVQAGAMNKDEAARLLRAKDYIPYYRMRGGNAELVIGGETPIRIGNLKDNPHLQELVGGEEPIFDFLTSSVQNTSMLLDMGLSNIARKNVAYELADVGLASKPTKVGKAGAPKGTLEFKLNGEDYFVRVDTDYIGVPSDLLVKGMAGIPTMLPQGLRLMGIPAQLLRRTVTALPVFAAKQLFRDSLGAYMLSGSNAPPLLGAINQLRKASPLKARGITGGQTFTGTTEDMSRLLKEMQEGRPGWMKAFAKMEALAHKADAATRQSQYESYRAQGLSDMEAELMALESMNFSKRGLSPTMHMASMLVPFLNAQIQGLDVLYKALTGKMPFNDKLDIQRKLFTRGASMFALTLAYAAAMQDDDEYKNATPDQKYGNWFLRLPFLDEMAGEKVTLRVPIPFEVGYIFKALPEMLYNSMKSDQGAKEALDALNHILIQIIPGGSSMVPIELGGAKIPVPVPIPAAMKPVIEVGLGKSFFTGRDIESAREQQEVPGMRYRDQTSELAKYIGKSVNFSPIKIEALINGYTGGMGLLALQALSVPLPKADVAVPEKRWSELPLVGSMFQPADASNIIDGVYKDFQKVTQAKTTYDELLVKGENAKAQAFLKENLQLIMLNQMAGEYKKEMGDLAKSERIIRGSKLTEEEKRKLLDRIKAAKIQIATAVRTAVDRTTPQASRP